MNRRYRLAAFDLDGTLLDSHNAMGEAGTRTLLALAAAGVTVVPATARMYQAAIRPFREIGLDVAAIASAGADIRDAAGCPVAQCPLPARFVPFVAGLCERAGWQTNLTTAQGTYRLDRELPPWAAAAPPWMTPVTTLVGLDLSGLLAVLANVAPGDSHLTELDAWANEVAAYSALSFNGDALLTITAAGVDKGTGLRSLCASLGIDPSEAVVFGDSDVDLPMFDVAGLAVAMGNAPDRVKDAAAFVTHTAEEGGVAAAIQRIWALAG